MNAISQFPQGRDDEDELQLRRESEKMQVIGRLAASVAHDFNNLLTGILLYCDLLSAGLEKNGRQNSESAERDADQFESAVAELVQQVEEVRMASEHGAALTRQLLAIARKQGPELRPVRINEIVLSTQNLLRRLIGEDIDLRLTPGRDLGHVRADPGQMEQVVMNLAVNARDAMKNSGKLTIKTQNVVLDEDYARAHAPTVAGNYVLLVVADTGEGMDEKVRAKIFEPFFSTKELGKGTGLGLSTVYGIVKQSGGYIWVSSESGKGTTFKIYLPRVAEVAEKAVQIIAAPESAVTEPGTETILLAEDEANLRYLARQFLEKQGYNVIEAADGAAAMQIAVAHEGVIHLLLTDVIMPGMNGR